VKDPAPITWRYLATHTSGILDHEKFYIQSYTKGLKPAESLEAYLKSYLQEGGARYSRKNFGKHKPGEAYAYSNIGAALAAYALQRASGTPFDQFTEDEILRPLGMVYSHWFYDANRMDRYSGLFDEADKPLEFYSLTTYPDGGLKTNAVDLARLLKALMLGYEGKSDFFEDPESWDLFFEKNFSETTPIEGLNPREPNSGIFVVYAKSGAIGHTGSDPGVSAFVFFNPKTAVGRVFVANEDITPANLDSFKEVWAGISGYQEPAAEHP
jgi:CubicO group peptidase (beta-lactamase class C family)